MKKKVLLFLIIVILSAGLFIAEEAKADPESYLAGYTTRKKLTIDHTKIDTDLTDFPVRVYLNADSDIGAVSNPDGFDIRFTSSDGTTLLKYERENFAIVSGEATGNFWVKIPSVSSSADTDFYIYYRTDDTADGADPTNVWDSSYMAVWHLADTNDSTSNANNGTAYGNATTYSSGKMGGAYSFDGSNDWIQVSDHDSLTPGQKLTISAWVYDTANDAAARGIVSKRTGSGNAEEYYNFKYTNKYTYFNISTDRDNDTTVQPTGSWFFLTVTFDGSLPSAERKKIYQNTTLTATLTDANTTVINKASNLHIGILNASYGNSWKGYLDEVRVSNTARSAAYIKADYNSGNNTLLTYGAEEEEVVGAEILEFTGDELDPDSTGDFIEEGVYSGQPYYYNSAKNFYLWWAEDISPGPKWIVSEYFDYEDQNWSSDSKISSTYWPGGGADGIGDMHVKVVVEEEEGSSDVYGWAWSENIGWISFNCNNPELPEPRCATSNYGVSVDNSTGMFSGYAWAGGGEDTYFETPVATIGWISFDDATVDLDTGVVSGWARACSVFLGDSCSGALKPDSERGGWDGWIKLKGMALDASPYGVMLEATTDEFYDWAWGGDDSDGEAVVGWISFNCSNEGTCVSPDPNYKVYANINNSPTVTINPITEGDYCDFTDPPIYLNWTFSDPPLNIQSAYQVQIDNNSDFSSPELDTGKVVSTSDTYTPPGLEFDEDYYWQIMVWDDEDKPSVGWVEGSFITDPPWPKPSFTYVPLAPVIDSGVAFDGEVAYCSPCIYAWVAKDSSGGTAWTSMIDDPTETFEVEDNYNVKFTTTSGTRSCDVSSTVSVGVGLPLPVWQEISSF